MANDLVSASSLDEFPGAPFPDPVIDSVVADLRREAGWHIAPALPVTLVLDGPDGPDLILPTLKLVEVVEIRDVSGSTPRVLTGWRASRTKGIVRRDTGWPCGFESIEVDVEHGYDDVPLDLLPVIASRCQEALSETTGSKFTIKIDDYTESTENTATAGEVDANVFLSYCLMPGR